MITPRFRALVAAALLSLGPLCGAAQAESKSIKLDGVVYEPQHPEQSIAIINGDTLKQGQPFEEYTLEEIGENYVLLLPEKGAPVRLTLWGSPYVRKAAVPIAISEIPELAPKTSASATGRGPSMAQGSMSEGAPPGLTENEQMAQRLQQTAGGFQLPNGMNVFGAIGMANEMKAMADIRRIFSACAMMANMEEVDATGAFIRPTFSFAEMKKRQILPEAMPERTGTYSYTVQNAKNGGCEVHAIPTNPASSRYLMVDEDGLMHAEHDHQATIQSPAP